jgi:hypothetical protein
MRDAIHVEGSRSAGLDDPRRDDLEAEVTA